jgi:CDP-glucose 4,6-dehydratase
MALAEKLFLEGQSYAEGWNFGPNDDDVHPVSWIVTDLARRWGGDARWLVDGGDHPHEARYLKLDVSKAKSRLGWYPRMTLETSLEAIVDWHRSFVAQADMRRVSLNQIKWYASL